MTLQQLQYFRVLSRVLHYTRAAQELHIAQPSLSYAIGELEKELGVKLFQKENRKISLTLFGEQFLPYVERSLSLLEEGTAVLEQLSGTQPQLVKLGYFQSISASLIPSMMEAFYTRPEHRDIRIQFSEGPSFDVFGQLRDGALDMAFGVHQADWAESVVIMRQPLYLVVPREHRLDGYSSVTFQDFAREPLVMLDKPSGLRRQLDRVFSQQREIPNVVFEVRECNAALQYVALRFGVSVLPQIPAMDSDKVSVIPISDQDKEFVRTVYFSWVRARPLSPAARRVRDFIADGYAID